MAANLEQGVLLTLAGMGLVFLVLALLWVLMALLMRADRRGAGQRHAPIETPAQPAVPDEGETLVIASASAGELSPEMLSAVMVAVRMHRRVRRKQAAPAMRTHQPGALPSRWVGAGRASQNQSWHPRHK